jgi:Flp pilus assembly protein TadG
MLLSIGFCAMALLLVWAVVDASVVFLDRRDLASAVDGAALAGAGQVDVGALYAGGVWAGPLALDPAAVRARLTAYVAQDYAPADHPGCTITGGVADGGTTVVVHGSRTVHLPAFGYVTVTADATASTRTVTPAP